MVALKLFLNAKSSFPYKVSGKLVTGNGSLIPICSLADCSLLPSLTVVENVLKFIGRAQILQLKLNFLLQMQMDGL